MKPCPRCGSPIGRGNDICIACHMKAEREKAGRLVLRKHWPAIECLDLKPEQQATAVAILEKALPNGPDAI